MKLRALHLKRITIFCFGFVVGGLIYSILFFSEELASGIMKSVAPVLLPEYLSLPVYALDDFLMFVCRTYHWSLALDIHGTSCEGLGLWGGPLEWIDVAWVYFIVGSYYGLIFVVFVELYRKIRSNGLFPDRLIRL